VIRVRCPSCGKVLSVAEDRAGQSVACRYCGQPVPVEIHADFADFAAPVPRADPRAEVRRLDEQEQREREDWQFLLLIGSGAILTAGTAVSVQPGVSAYLTGYLGSLLGGLLGGAALPALTAFLVTGGGPLRRGLLAALPTVKDPAAVTRVVNWIAALGFICGAAAGAYKGAAHGNPDLDTPLSAALAYGGAVLGALPALVWRWRRWRGQGPAA